MTHQEKDTGIADPGNYEAGREGQKGRKRFDLIKNGLLRTWNRADETLRDIAVKANLVICPAMFLGYGGLGVYHFIDGSPGKAAISLGTAWFASSVGIVALGLSGGLKRITDN